MTISGIESRVRGEYPERALIQIALLEEPGGYGELHRLITFYHRGHREHRGKIVAVRKDTLRYAQGKLRSTEEGCTRKIRDRYFFRSTRKRASDFSVSAREPKLSSAAQAVSACASAFFSDSSIPNSAG